MKPAACLQCGTFPCPDVRHECFAVPAVDLAPDAIKLIVIAEAAPAAAADYFYAGPDALFAQTTLQAFREAGFPAASIDDLTAAGVYLTTAVKCAKTGYAIAPATVKACARLLEQELALFPQARVLMLMGDVAIRAVNEIARRRGAPRPVPAGATYKIRGGEFRLGDWRVFPSYLQAGPSFFIEKSKRRMIAEDIAAALSCIHGGSPLSHPGYVSKPI